MQIQACERIRACTYVLYTFIHICAYYMSKCSTVYVDLLLEFGSEPLLLLYKMKQQHK